MSVVFHIEHYNSNEFIWELLLKIQQEIVSKVDNSSGYKLTVKY